MAKISMKEGAPQPQANQDFLRKIPLEGVKKRILVSSGKGGTGKSFVSVVLSLMLASRGKKVGLLDIDVHGPNTAIMLGLEGKKILANAEQKLLPIEAGKNLKVVSAAFILDEAQPLVWRGPMKGKLITDLLGQSLWGELDYLIVDSPPGTGDELLTITQKLEFTGTIVVGTPQKAAEYDVKKSINMMKHAGVKIIGLVENMSEVICGGCGKAIDVFGKGRLRKLAEKEHLEFLSEIPIDIDARKMVDEGKIELSKLDPKISSAFEIIIGKLEKL